MKISIGRFVGTLVVAMAMISSLVTSAGAATVTYTGAGANNNWSTGTNWVPQPVANGDSVFLSASAGADKSMTNDSISILANMTFTTSGNTLGGLGTLAIDSLGTVRSQTGVNTINQKLSVPSGAITLQADGTSLLRINGGIDGGIATIAQVGTGIVELNGTGTFNGNYSLSAGSTLAGSGIHPGLDLTASAGSFLTPGPNGAIGATEFGDVNLLGTVSMGIDDTTNFDNVIANGTLAYGGALNIAYNDPSFLPNYTSWNLFDATGAISGDFTAFNWTAVSPYSGLSFSQYGSGVTGGWKSNEFVGFGGQMQFFAFENGTGNLILVPEPSTMVFAAIGLVVSGAHVMRKRRQASAVAAG